MKKLSDISLPDGWNDAISTGHPAFDELLGNCGNVYGARYGKIILFSAQSGTGKTRLCLTMLDKMVKNNPDLKVGHFTGEQSVLSLAIMGKTMAIEFNENVLGDAESFWPDIEKKIIENNIQVVVIDSYPMLTFPIDTETKKALDTKARVGRIAEIAAKYNLAVILLNHTDKKGNRGGRNELLHLVDVAYTMRVVPDGKGYDGVKVVEFRCDKNREGVPVSRAFPFNGRWDFDTPYELNESTGNETGEANASKVEERKQFQRECVLNNFREFDGIVTREDVENGVFTVTGLAKSGILSLLRTLTDEGTLEAHHESTGKRGKAPIVRWTLIEKNETEIPDEEEGLELVHDDEGITVLETVPA